MKLSHLESGPQVRYLAMAACIIVFVILYVWQNITVMKIKMNYRRALAQEIELRKKNDSLRFEIEQYRRAEVIEEYAKRMNMKRITAADVDVVYAAKGKQE